VKETTDTAFINRITGIILDHMDDFNFGTKELVRRSGLSRYRLIKKLHKETGKGISQFIREMRLRKAFELLQDDSLTIAEIAYKTGFGSPQYFNKCFRDFYGYPPGKIRNNISEDLQDILLTGKGLKTVLLKYYPAFIIFIIFIILVSTIISNIYRTSDATVRKNIAVMPFQNLTNDPDMDIWQSALQHDMITSLASTGELNVILEQSILTNVQNQSTTKSQLTSSTVENISKKLHADYFVIGSIQRAGEQVRIEASMYETQRAVILRSFEVNGQYSDGKGMFNLGDSLRKIITQYMLVSKIISENPSYQHAFTAPESVEALRYYQRALKTEDLREKIRLLKKSLAFDTTFYQAALSLEYTYSADGNSDSSKIWLIKNYRDRDKMSDYDRLQASWAYAYTFQSYNDQINDLINLVQMDMENPENQYMLGLIYCLSGQYEKAIPHLEISLQIFERWGDEFLKDKNNFRDFKWLGIAYNNTGRLKKQAKLNKKAEKYIDHPWMDLMKSTYSLSIKDTTGAIKFIDKARRDYTKYFRSGAYIDALVGDFLKDANKPEIAEKYYRSALKLEPENLQVITKFFNFCYTFKKHHDPELVKRAMKLCKNRQLYYELLSEKGMCLYMNGDKIAAIDTIQKAWDEAPFKVYRIKYYLEQVKKRAPQSQ
jgi:AraC-like DNA-binding protein/TolB-like protein